MPTHNLEAAMHSDLLVHYARAQSRTRRFVVPIVREVPQPVGLEAFRRDCW